MERLLKTCVKSVSGVIIVRSVSLFVLLAGAGCHTTGVSDRSSIEEGAKVEGSDGYRILTVDVRPESRGVQERFVVHTCGQHAWNVSRTKKVWKVKTRTRYLSVAGVHKEYTVVDDLIIDPVMLTLVSVVVPPISLTAGLLGGDHDLLYGGWVILGAAVIAQLPGISANFPEVMGEEVKGEESVCSIDPADRKTDCDLEFDAVVADASGSPVAKRRSVGNGWCDVPICDTILHDPERPVVAVTVSSEQAKIACTNTFKFTYDLADIVDRKLKAVPDPNRYPAVCYAVGKPKLPQGRADGRVVSGTRGVISIPVTNEGPGDGYRLRGWVLSCTGTVRATNSCDVLLVRAGKGSVLDVPFSIPVTAGDGEGVIRIAVRDALGRQSEPVAVAVAHVARPLPSLQVTGASLAPCAGEPGVWALEVGLRNKGEGAAEAVRVRIACESGAEPLDREQAVGELGPYSRGTARLRVKVPGDVTTGRTLRVNVSVSERLGVGNTTTEVEVCPR